MKCGVIVDNGVVGIGVCVFGVGYDGVDDDGDVGVGFAGGDGGVGNVGVAGDVVDTGGVRGDEVA